MNDPPPTKISTEGDGSVSRKNDRPLESAPVVRHVVGSHIAGSKERARHNPHGLLCVIPTVANTVSRGGNQLEPAEPVVD